MSSAKSGKKGERNSRLKLTQDRVALQWAFTAKTVPLQDILPNLSGRACIKKIRQEKSAGQDGDGSGKKWSCFCRRKTTDIFLLAIF
ncbi:MAG: hypothetical protein NT087_06185 [Deltaproteobacteria bacterium]|nr:hypothetical protein [Deltaproteobacteria bacterium]